MDELIIFAVLLIGWTIIGPVLGLIGIIRAGAAKREARAVHEELGWMRRQLHGESAPQPQPQPQPQFPIRSQAEQAPTPQEQMRGEQVFPGKPRASAPEQTPPPAPQPVSTPPPRARSGMNLERMIAANWMVWAGGLALALGGLFLVRVAMDAGLFGPMARVLAATLMGMGLIAAAFRGRGMDLVQNARNGVRFLPHILAAAGIITLYGAAIGLGLIYGFVPPLIALALIVLISALAVALSLIFGPVLAALGLTGAYIAPLLTGSDSGSILPLLPYFAIVTGAGLTLVRLKGWRFLSWLSLIGAGLWGVAAVGSSDLFAAPIVTAYALGLGLTGMYFGARDARHALALPDNGVNLRYIAAGLGESQLAAHLFWVLAGALIVLAGLEHGVRSVLAGGLALYGGLSLFASWRRPGFALITPIAAGVTIICLILWPGEKTSLAYACLAAGLAFGLIGTLVATRLTLRAPVAAAAALMPPATLFIAFWRGGELAVHFGWGLIALAIAVLLGMVLDAMRRDDPDLKRHKGAASAYALGAILSAVLAPFLMLSGLWLGSAIAVVAAAIALVMRRFDLPLMRLAGPAAVAAGTGLLVRPGMLSGAVISSVPVFNEMTFGFAIAIAALVIGARLTLKHPRVRRAYEAGAMVLGFSLIALTIRHIAGGGELNGPFDGMGEASAYAIAYLGMAASFAWRFKGENWLWRTGEYVAAAIGIGGIFMAITEIGSSPVGDVPILNLLLPAFAMPALVLAVYASGLRHAARRTEARIAGAGAMLTGFVWVSLEVARTIGTPMLRDWYGDAAWAYSPAWIAYAFALLFWGVWKQRSSARYASLAILILAIGKVFLIDMSALDGVARAGSFIGLGIALIGVALFYQRYVFGGRASGGSRPAQSPL